jgi:hypothetical protein
MLGTVLALPPLPIDVMSAEAESLDLSEQINREVTFEGDLDEVFVYTFEASAGDALSIYVFSQGEIDTILHLFAPDGSLVAVDDDSGATNDPEIEQVILPQDGEYRLAIQPYVNGARGSLNFFVSSTAPFAWDGDTITYGIASKIVVYSPLVIEASEGDVLRLNVRRADPRPSAFTPIITVSQDGVILAQNAVGVGAGLAIDFAVPEDGEVLIEFSYQGVGGTVLEVSLDDAE